MFRTKSSTNSGKHKYAFIIFCLFLFNSILAHADIVLNFGIYASDKPSEMVKKFRPVLNVLETRLSRLIDAPVIISLQVASSYKKGVDALVSGEVDFARFGPASYINAKNQDPGISIIAVESKNGSKIFNGVICVRIDSTITSVEDLKGKSFAFGDPQSTIGRYLSQAYLGENGITANELGSYQYLGRHDRVGSAVAAGKFDAGALKEGTFEKLLKKGAQLRAIAVFPNVTKPWISRRALPPRIFKALQVTLLALKDPEALKALKKDGFLAGSDEDYDRIRKAIKNNPRFFE